MKSTIGSGWMVAMVSGALLSACASMGGPRLPGDTLASPLLQQDTLKVARILAGSKECRDPKVVDTAVLTDPIVPGKKWEERWTFDRCGEPKSIHVLFTPDGRGGTYMSISEE